MRQRGIVSDWRVGSKRKVCEGIHRRSHTMHSFSTRTIIVQFFLASVILAAYSTNFLPEEQSLHSFPASGPEDKEH
jgi:hypothetical protein